MRAHIKTLTLLAGLILFLVRTLCSTAAEAPGVVGTFTNAEAVVQAYQQLQLELKATRDAMDVARRAGDAEARRQAERLGLQLARLEKEIETQKLEKQQLLKSVESANQQNLSYAALFAGVALLAVMAMSFLQLRATAKLTDLTLNHFPERLQLPPPSPPPAPSNGGRDIVLPSSPDTDRLLRSVERLERRIQELESTGAPPASIGFASSASTSSSSSSSPSGTAILSEPAHAGGKSGGIEVEGSAAVIKAAGRKALAAASLSAAVVIEEAGSNGNSIVGGILGKGDSLLQLGQAEAALSCFDEALSLDSRSVDAWVKKGSALEKLDRMEQALGCYNRALELDRGSTLAYLYKGGVCNRLERFDEALACYEQALKSQERPG